MAESPAPPDPLSAERAVLEGKLEHQLQTTLGNYAEARSQARAKTGFERGLLGEREPLSYKANQHRANAGGILESGINGQRRQGIAAEYGNKRAQLTAGLLQTEGNIAKGERRERENRDIEGARNRIAALGEQEKTAGETQAPGYPRPEGAANPGGARTRLGPSAYFEKTPGGSVLVGESREEYLAKQPTSKNATVRARQEAARKALGVG